MTSAMKLNDQGLLRHQAYVDGAWRDAYNGAVIEVCNPSTGARIGTVPRMGIEETHEAVQAAEAAWPAWRALNAGDRAHLLRRWHALILDNLEDLAAIMTAEQGKPLAESRAEVRYGAGFVQWFAEEARRIYGDVVPAPAADRRIVVVKEPVGVVAAITPWNFPHAMITRKAAPALAAGCPFVLKPASQTPFSALALAVLAERAGLPRGLFNVVTGAAEAIAGEMTANPAVRKLSFTGSTETGRQLMRQCADGVKRLSLELGGNAPFIVFDDADIDLAVAGAMVSKFRNSGQTCVCVNRILVQDGIHDAFVERLTRAVKTLKVSDGFEVGAQQGPLIDEAAVRKVEEQIADAVSKGGKLAVGGRRHSRGGTFFQPTVVTGARPGMALAREEIFGPVAPLFRFRTEAEAIKMANDTEYGLASYLYTRDLARAWRVAEALEFGMVGINESLISTEVAPFGGIKQSGLGREGSKYGIEEYLETKYLCMGGIAPALAA